jgi:hypothetical protein
MPAATTTRRCRRLLAGLLLIAAGSVLTLRAHLGLDPWDGLHDGLRRRTPLSFGQAMLLVSLATLMVTWTAAQRPGIGTVANMLLVGPLIDLCCCTPGWAPACPMPRCRPEPGCCSAASPSRPPASVCTAAPLLTPDRTTPPSSPCPAGSARRSRWPGEPWTASARRRHPPRRQRQPRHRRVGRGRRSNACRLLPTPRARSDRSRPAPQICSAETGSAQAPASGVMPRSLT